MFLKSVNFSFRLFIFDYSIFFSKDVLSDNKVFVQRIIQIKTCILLSFSLFCRWRKMSCLMTLGATVAPPTSLSALHARKLLLAGHVPSMVLIWTKVASYHKALT